MFFRNVTSFVLLATVATAQIVPQQLFAQLDTSDRWKVRDFFNYVYPYGSDAELGWTGTYEGVNPTAGDISPQWREATRMRINFYRHLAGLQPNITFEPARNAASQESAFILSDTDVLNHYPEPEDSFFWTPAGAEAAEKGNIGLDDIGSRVVDIYMLDPGEYRINNYDVGHRRAFLYPLADKMGSGDVPGNGDDFRAANTIWVRPDDVTLPRPATRDNFVAWPPRGHIPADLVWPRWSLSYPGANFASATVSMLGPNGLIPLVVEHRTELPSPEEIPTLEETIVWVPNSMDTNQFVTWPIGEEDEAISVTIGNVTVDGQQVGPFEYTVNIFNPSILGLEEKPTTLQAPLVVNVGQPAEFQIIHSRSWKDDIEVRTFVSEPIDAPLDAEIGLGDFLAETTGDYETIVSGHDGNQTNFYRLAQTNFDPQFLILQTPILVGNTHPTISFISNINGSTKIQAASLQAYSDGSWETLWYMIGNGEQGEYNPTFIDVPPIDLSSYANRFIRLRFKFELINSGKFSNSAGPNDGWAFDDITFTDVHKVVDSNVASVEIGENVITATFPSTTPTYIQARDIAFSEMGTGGFPLEWGPAILVTPDADGFTLAGTPVNIWSEHPTVGLVYGFSSEWIFSDYLEWLYVPNGDWIYSGIGWLKYISGDIQNGLWLYSPIEGFVYVQESNPGEFLRSPFSGEQGTWGSFRP